MQAVTHGLSKYPAAPDPRLSACYARVNAKNQRITHPILHHTHITNTNRPHINPSQKKSKIHKRRGRARTHSVSPALQRRDTSYHSAPHQRTTTGSESSWLRALLLRFPFPRANERAQRLQELNCITTRWRLSSETVIFGQYGFSRRFSTQSANYSRGSE